MRDFPALWEGGWGGDGGSICCSELVSWTRDLDLLASLAKKSGPQCHQPALAGVELPSFQWGLGGGEAPSAITASFKPPLLEYLPLQSQQNEKFSTAWVGTETEENSLLPQLSGVESPAYSNLWWETFSSETLKEGDFLS